MAHSLSKFGKVGQTFRSWPAGLGAGVILVIAVLYQAVSGELHFFERTPVDVAVSEFGSARLARYSPFTSSFISSIWPQIAVAFFLTLLAARLTGIIAKARKQNPPGAVDEESGSSAVEFILVLPPLLALLLMILQIALIVQAKFVVNYAAFCAARSAIVVIPDEISGGGPPEPRNQLASPNTSQKVEIIRRAAALPVTAISPLPGISFSRGVPFLTDPNAVAELLKLAPFDVGPRSMVGQVMLRAPYAYHEENTAVKVMTLEGVAGRNYRDHDWVTVKVSYRYYLAVPFAKQLFGTSYTGNPIWTTIFGTDFYYPIVEQYTLPMDGEPTAPGL